ncbi:MAG TPA: nucleoside-diphosphate sugar epimerase [Flavobacteriales bacterium]|nr:nucleoside-diphosphate sugar epimerase [Crocinitomicaceae bacterium]HAE30647.1 nucleoside-diphosphate sugar epimerase [Flavobacteriales bacterium]
MSKKIVVTGGAGFIGSALIKHLIEDGHEIFVIDNLSFGNRDFVDVDNDHFFECDILDRGRIHSLLADVNPDWVIHLAAIHFIPYCNEHPFEAADINIRGTINVIDACKQLENLKRFFFASTAAVYPISDDAVHEEHPLCPLDIYGLTKLAGERLSHEFHLETGVSTIVCRFFNAFGPNETNPHLIPEIQKQINLGMRTIQLGNLDPKRDFIHTYDMARAVIALMNSNIDHDIFNLGRGIEYSVREIVESFERELGESITIEQDPERIRKTDRMHLLADVSKLKSAIGWEPEWGIDQGVKTLINK